MKRCRARPGLACAAASKYERCSLLVGGAERRTHGDAMSTSAERRYAMGRSVGETGRLITQGGLYGDNTRRLFEQAGIGPGMKVLDVGSGAGDVALLAADLV